MKDLHYKAKNIMRAEKEHKLGFYQVLQSMQSNLGVFTVFFLLTAGGYSEEEAGELIDNKPFDEVLLHIVDALGDAGFLPEAAKVQIRAQMQKAREQIAAASPSNGESSDQEPTK